jgi:hydroxyethylthiazole kinase-like uncharacterized protein yjeF
MKVVSSAEMSRIETIAYGAGAKPEQFMESAGRGIALHIEDYIRRHRLTRVAVLLCGKGNNAGDAYVAGSHLHRNGYAVFAYQLEPIDTCSPLCRQNYYRFVANGGVAVDVKSAADFLFPPGGVIVDALFGTGFHGAAEGLYAAAITTANGSGVPILAIDIPSGLNGQTGEATGPVIEADETLFLGLPKTGFFLNQGWNCIGRLTGIDFGLNPEIIRQAQEDMIYLTVDQVVGLLPKLKRARNKYEAGVVVGLAGSLSMPGAAQLASLAALRGGCGLMRLLHPESMSAELANTAPEVIRVPYREGDIEAIVDSLNSGDSCFIGPGLGRDKAVRSMLAKVLPQVRVPCVIDADALTIAAEDNIPFPPHAILTPHQGEMRRLLQGYRKERPDKEWLALCQEYVREKLVTLVLKGPPTFILHPKEDILVCPRGDTGMATAGTGDVLTGVIAALLAQGVHGRDAAAVGAYLHGIAGERAADQFTSQAMIASDVIAHLPDAFKELSHD